MEVNVNQDCSAERKMDSMEFIEFIFYKLFYKFDR